MRRVKEIKQDVISRPGKYTEVRSESADPKAPAPLKVKQVYQNGTRYIVCLNQSQARKDSHDRAVIVDALKEQLKKGPKSLVGNKGYRKYLKIEGGSTHVDEEKIKNEQRFDGKWVLRTNTDLPADQVALKYKELLQVEKVFRDVKSLLETRPIFHQRDRTIRSHVFCSFLALVLRKELDGCLESSGHTFEWKDIKQDLKALHLVIIEDFSSFRTKLSNCIYFALSPTIAVFRS